MIRLVALVSYVYQSAAAIVLIFAISHILPSADYTRFSLVLASSQLLCVFMFEWLQLAGLRFLAAAKGEDAARLRWSLFAAGLLSALVLVLVGSAASLASTLARDVVVLGLAVAVLQGITDLYFLAIRLSDRLGAASFLMILRASLLLVGAVCGASLYGTTEATLLGTAFGHTAGLVTGLIAHRTPLRKVPRRTMLADWANFSRYGMLAAGASVIHLAVPVMIRFIVVGRLGATGASAGFSMALDLLQRPFWVLIAAIHTVNYPEVVDRFEHGPDWEAKKSTARLFDFVVCATVVMLGGLLGFLPDAGRILVPHDALGGFLAVAPTAAVFYFLHTNLQATLAIIPHLQKSATRLVIVAMGQLAMVSVFSAIALAAGFSSSVAVAAASVATAIVIVSASGPTIRFGAIPRWSLVMAATAVAILIGSLSAAPSQPLIWLVGKIALSATATAFIAWRGDFLMMARRD
jgi:O-antigen/teichoic acid export membrane protein